MNIEKTISEHAVSDILTPMLESQDRIVTEDVAPLFEQATGLDTPPASGTVTTTIEESRSVISAIIRKAWTAPLTMLFGASVIGYITAAYTYLRNRLQGNETYGIPDRRSEISASSPLAANLALLNDRKIGGADCQDGTSLIRLLLDSTTAATITEMTDDTDEWVAGRMLTQIITLFPNVTKITANCSKAVGQLLYGGNVEDLQLPNLKIGACNTFGGRYISHKGKVLELPEMTHFGYIDENTPESDYYGGLLGSDSTTEELYMPKLRYIGSGYFLSTRTLGGPTKLWKFVMDKPAQVHPCTAYGETKMFGGRSDYAVWRLIYVEICHSGDLLDHSFNMDSWEPKYALMADPTEEGYIDLRHDKNEQGEFIYANNLEQFLSNFKTYIAERLKGFPIGQGPTLTLSQAVFSEIWDSQGQPQVKGDGLDQLRADIHRIIRTDKQWAVNKA